MAGPITPLSNASLSVFNGANPNGTWTLFAFDDTTNGLPALGSGINGGRGLEVTTAEGAPIAQPDRFRAQAGKTLSVPAAGVLENDSDPDDDPLTATLVKKSKQGTVALQADGSFTYRANKKATGTDTFTYRAEDPTGLNATATVTIQIKGTNDKKDREASGGNNGKRKRPSGDATSQQAPGRTIRPGAALWLVGRPPVR